MAAKIRAVSSSAVASAARFPDQSISRPGRVVAELRSSAERKQRCTDGSDQDGGPIVSTTSSSSGILPCARRVGGSNIVPRAARAAAVNVRPITRTCRRSLPRACRGPTSMHRWRRAGSEWCRRGRRRACMVAPDGSKLSLYDHGSAVDPTRTSSTLKAGSERHSLLT